jgi:hypothetical protein
MIAFTDSLCAVTCQCGHTAPLEQFTDRPITGQLQGDAYQCPACNRAWRRTKGKRRYNGDLYPPLKIQPIAPSL